jgi:hypothetical protein
MGHGREAAALAAICWLIYDSIGHGDAKGAHQEFVTLCGLLGYDKRLIESVVTEAYAARYLDGGQRLIEQAFAEPGSRSQ